jgi:hypothetical protein
MEDIPGDVRAGKLALTPGMIETLLKAHDAITELKKAIGGAPAAVDVQAGMG